jgi:4a-hydroxytetrahydrobiopterin dehydratase
MSNCLEKGAIMSTERVYSEEEITARIQSDGLGEWFLEDGWLRRKVATDGWQTTLQVVNVIGFLCEAAWHHADLSVSWAKITIKLRTHSAGGITDKDFALAKKFEEVIFWRPAQGGPLEGTPNKFVKTK